MTSDTEIIQSGAANWKERLQPLITFVSPQGTFFEAYWQGSPRTKEKKLGVFEFPLVNGTSVQDLATRGSRYSLNFFFEGPNHDISARAFYAAIEESGQWEVLHPVHGYLGLVPQSITTIDNPTESGNITEVQSDWIEPIDEFTLLTARELIGAVQETKDAYNSLGAQQFITDTSTDDFSETARTGNTLQGISEDATENLGELAKKNDVVNARFIAVQSQLSNNVASEEIDIDILPGQIQTIIQAPSLASDDIAERLSAYVDMATAAIARLPENKTDSKSKNQAVAVDMALGALLGAAANSVVFGTAPKTRKQAIQAAETVLGLFQTITNAMDGVQADFEDQFIDKQFFSQPQTYTLASELVGQVIQYLLLISFDLRIERRYLLKEPSTPLMIVLDQYGSEKRLNEFIEANNFKDLDILFLESGREVVLYV